MREYSYLTFMSLTCCLAPGDQDIAGAEAQWQRNFGVGRNLDGRCEFLNGVKLNFLPGGNGKKDGLVAITIGVKSSQKLQGILARAKEQGCSKEDGIVEMLGIQWRFEEGKDLPLESTLSKL